MAILANFDDIRQAFKNGTVATNSDAELADAVSTLANTTIANDSLRHEALIMADAIHSLMLRRLLDAQEQRNQKAEFWFMVLAVAGVVSAVVQIAVAIVKP